MVYTRNLIYFLPIADENFIITRVFRMISSPFIYYFFGCARQEKLFFGSISILEIIVIIYYLLLFWADGSYPSLSTTILNIYEYPPGILQHDNSQVIFVLLYYIDPK